MTRLALAVWVLALPLADAGVPDLDRDRALLALATQAAQAHRQADALSSDPMRALEPIRAALELPHPDVRDAWALRADLHARLAQLWLSAGNADAARNAALAGLAEQELHPDAAFAAQLWLRLGAAQEAGGADLQAVKAYQSAIAAAQRALQERQERQHQ